MVKTVVVEEHNEAFFVWHWAKNQGLIPSRDNYLLHIDEHADMSAPRLRQSIKDLNGDFIDVVAFTYRELSISSFIIPAVYQGLINEIYWAKQMHKGTEKKERVEFVRSYNSQGKFMIRMLCKGEDVEKISTIEDDDRKQLKIYLGAEDDIPEQREVLLDEEYERFTSDKYHALRFVGPRFEAKEADGQFYYEINETDEIYTPKLKTDEGSIAVRVQELIDSLKAKDIQPQLISLCRSKISGYTPEDQCEFIQELLVNGLDSIYDMDICHIEDILKG